MPNELSFRVEVWDDKDGHIEEIIALTSDYATAKTVYAEAVKRTWKVHHASAEDESDPEHAEKLTVPNSRFTTAAEKQRGLLQRGASYLHLRLRRYPE